VASGKPEKKHPLWTGTRSGQVLDNAMAGVRQSWAIALRQITERKLSFGQTNSDELVFT
jgi:hypothetical protein